MWWGIGFYYQDEIGDEDEELIIEDEELMDYECDEDIEDLFFEDEEDWLDEDLEGEDWLDEEDELEETEEEN